MVTELPNQRLVRTCDTCRYFDKAGKNPWNCVCKIARVSDPEGMLFPTHRYYVCDAHSYRSPALLAKLKIKLGISDDFYMDFE